MSLLIFYTILAITISFVCSVLEATLLSVTPAFVSARKRDGSKTGRRLYRLKADLNRPLAAILSLNTIANTIGAAGVGAQAAIVFGSAYVGITSGILTLLILFFAELIPKTLGALYWRKLAPVAAHVLPIMVIVLSPLVIMALAITRRLSKGKMFHQTSREELSALSEIGVDSGVLSDREMFFLQNILKFSSIKVSTIMTPRTVVFALQENTVAQDVVEKHADVPFSRIPVYDEDIDDITGFVLKNDVLMKVVNGNGGCRLAEIRRDIEMVPDFISLLSLFEKLADSGQHMALVVDEYGGVEGIVTLEDVVETLLGMEIVDELDQVADMQQVARKLRRARERRTRPGE